jgi:serine/threonine-protein kinase
MLTGTLPFLDSEPEKLLHMHISDPPPRPSDHVDKGAIPEKLETIIMACLEKAPWNRPENMGQVLESLAEVT